MCLPATDIDGGEMAAGRGDSYGPVVDRGGRMGGVGAAADAGGEGDSLLSAGGA
jgi:hypothetical protein